MIDITLQFFGNRGASSGSKGGGGGVRSANFGATGGGAVSTVQAAQAAMDLRSSGNASIKNGVTALRDAKNESTASARGIQKTLQNAARPEGAFNSDFNDDRSRSNATKVLNRVAPGQYEFRQVSRTQNVNFGRGWGVVRNATVNEWRLFKKG